MLKMNLEYKDDTLYVYLKGKLNKRNCYKINSYLNPILKKHKISNLIFILIHLKDIDEVGLDALKRSKYLVKSYNGSIKVWGCDKSIQDKIKDLRVRKIKYMGDAYV